MGEDIQSIGSSQLKVKLLWWRDEMGNIQEAREKVHGMSAVAWV